MGAVVEMTAPPSEAAALLLRTEAGHYCYASRDALQQGVRYHFNSLCGFTVKSQGLIRDFPTHLVVIRAGEIESLQLLGADKVAPERRLVQSGQVTAIEPDPRQKGTKPQHIVRIAVDGEIQGKHRTITAWTANLKQDVPLRKGSMVAFATTVNPGKNFAVTVDLIRRQTDCLERDISGYTSAEVQIALERELGINVELGINSSSSRIPGLPASLMRITGNYTKKVDLASAFEALELHCHEGEQRGSSREASGLRRLNRSRSTKKLTVLINSLVSSQQIPVGSWVEAIGKLFQNENWGKRVDSFYLLLPADDLSTPKNMQTVNDFTWRFSQNYGVLTCGFLLVTSHK